MKWIILFIIILIVVPVLSAKNTSYSFSKQTSENVINHTKEADIIAVYRSSSELSKDYIIYFIIAAMITLGVILIKNAIHSKSNC